MTQEGVPVLRAVATSTRPMYQLLRCINFAPRVHVQITEQGIRFAADHSRVMQGMRSRPVHFCLDSITNPKARRILPLRRPLLLLRRQPAPIRRRRGLRARQLPDPSRLLPRSTPDLRRRRRRHAGPEGRAGPLPQQPPQLPPGRLQQPDARHLGHVHAPVHGGRRPVQGHDRGVERQDDGRADDVRARDP